MTNIGHAWENMVIREADRGTGERHLRVLYVRRQRGEAALVDLGDARCFPYWVSLDELETQLASQELEHVDDPCRATMRREDELTASEKAVRDARWNAIAPMVESGDRHDLDAADRQAWVRDRVQEISEERRASNGEGAKGIRSDKIVGYLRLYWRGGQVKNALVPLFLQRGAPGVQRIAEEGSPKVGRRPNHSGRDGNIGFNVTGAVLRTMLRTGVSLRKKRDQTDAGAYEEFTNLYFSKNLTVNGVSVRVKLPTWERPTLRQFIYQTDKELEPEEKLVAQKGPTAMAQRHRPRLGNTRHLHFGPGSVFQIDATIGDFYLRSRDDPSRLVGRPVIYIIVDMYSRMIVGFTVALHGPSWECAALALENAFSNKVEYCAKLGIKIAAHEWPAEHSCAGLMGDRGWEHLSKHADGAQTFFGYKLSTLPPYRADLKGLAENQFNFVKGIVKFVPGDWRARPKGEKKNVLDGAMTLQEFEKFMALKIMKRNATLQVTNPPLDWDCTQGRAPTPNMLWAHGIVAHGTPDRPDLTRIRQGLLKSGIARTSDKGLLFNGLPYVREAGGEEGREQFLRRKGKKWVDVGIRYAEADVSRILVPVDRGQRFINYVRPPKSRFVGYTFSEVADWVAAQAADKRSATDRDAEASAYYNALAAKVVKDARAAGSDDVTRTRQPHTDPEARDEESRAARVNHAAVALGGPLIGGPPAPVNPPPGALPLPGLRPNRLAMFQQLREELASNRPEN